jgi:uncharacterized protein (DUF1697 family)
VNLTMPRQVALLRGVNLGTRQVVMSELKRVCEGAGCRDVRTLIASGNVVLTSSLSGEQLERKLERAVAKALGLDTAVFVRTAGEMAAVMTANPFPEFAARDPARFVVFFLKTTPSAAEKKVLEATQGGPEQQRVVGREVYVIYPEGQARSRLKLKALGTARNWNTVTKLAALASGE